MPTTAGQELSIPEQVAARVYKRITRRAANNDDLRDLLDQVEATRAAHEKGIALEKLAAALFATIPGLKVTQRVRTTTEEIDLLILNESTDPLLRREGPLILAEWKHYVTARCWSTRQETCHK